ncbi:hypothetical protein CYANOKiyG1_09440 [Okeania sp. KiyG1]|nr:hypothetical protein CYANOKiyG1_09440 [Okeania sp. KiyG1]
MSNLLQEVTDRATMKSFKTKLKLKLQQKTILAKHAGVAPDCL